MLYQDVRNNCVFVSYHADKPVFATLKGTNTYVPFSGDVSGSDYRYCWHMGNGSQRLQVYEAPIDAMSRMSMFLHSGKNYLDYDYLALTGTGKYEAVFHHLRAAEAEGRPYTDVYVCTDNDSGGTLCLENISRTLKQDFPDTAVHADRPLITNDWNDELKYVFAHGWRYENYINPFDEQLQGILETQLLALANGNTKEYYQIADQLQKSGFPRDTGLENYMIDYLQKNYDKTMSELMSGKGQHTAIKISSPSITEDSLLAENGQPWKPVWNCKTRKQKERKLEWNTIMETIRLSDSWMKQQSSMTMKKTGFSGLKHPRLRKI